MQHANVSYISSEKKPEKTVNWLSHWKSHILIDDEYAVNITRMLITKCQPLTKMFKNMFKKMQSHNGSLWDESRILDTDRNRNGWAARNKSIKDLECYATWAPHDSAAEICQIKDESWHRHCSPHRRFCSHQWWGGTPCTCINYLQWEHLWLVKMLLRFL